MSEPIDPKEPTTTVLKKYYLPTPKKWRQIGDSILWATGALSAALIPANLPVWAYVTLNAIGIIGKFITNFFTEEEA